MGTINYSFELFEYDSALSGNLLITSPPEMSSISIDDFREGTHFRTTTDINNALVLDSEDKLLAIIVDESGSMTWNDEKGDRYTYFTRLLRKLKATYPGVIKVNLFGFGGSLISTTIFISRDANASTVSAKNFDQLMLDVFENSVYDFSGVRVVRRTYDPLRGDGDPDSPLQYPQDPNDGTVVFEGLFQCVKDSNLTLGTVYYYGIWSFNKYEIASKPQYIRAFPCDRDLPEGVHFANATIRVLTGIQRDNYTQLIYNFAEGKGSVVYDSSGNGRHGFLSPQSITENFWAGDATISSYTVDGSLKYRVGVRFDGEFNLIESHIDKNVAFISGSQSLTICFWAYRYSSVSDEWIIGTSTTDVTNDVGWAIGFSSAGEILLSFTNVASGFSIFTGSFVAEKTWTHVSIILSAANQCLIYLNGLYSSTTAIPPVDTSSMSALYIGAKPTDSSVTWPNTDYFGIIANLSISNTIRSESFISELYLQESMIFTKSLLSESAAPLDNGQREVLLNWIIGASYNFAGGKVKILRKRNSIPAHDEDGEIILEADAEEGEFVYLDNHDFIHGSDYFYRVFTYKKVLTNQYLVCDRADARVLSVYVPRIPHVSDLAPPAGISSLVVTPGDRKVLLEWINPTTSEYRGTKVFCGQSTYPTPSYTTTGIEVVNGTEIVDTTDESYIHRILGRTPDGSDVPLQNDKMLYYTIITYDQFGVFSNPVFATASPSSDIDSVFDPAEVTDLHIEVVNPKTLSIRWKSPITKSEQIDAYMGETALVFTNIRDIFGGPVSDITNMSYEIWAYYVERDLSASNKELGYEEQITENVSNADFAGEFPTTPMNKKVADEIILNQGVVSSGLLKGSVSLVTDPATLARRNSYDIIVRAKYKVTDPETKQDVFIFNSEAVRVVFHNPMRISIINKHNRKVTPPRKDNQLKGDASVCVCPPEDNQIDPTPVDGAYCNSTRPYVARVEVQFKGQSLPDGYPISISLWKDRSMTTKPTRATIKEGYYASSSIEIEDENGHTIKKSYVDVEVPVPTMPETVFLYANVNYNGFIGDGLHTITFLGALFIELDCRKPIPNGINSEEQFASVYMVHPDYPNDPNMRILPPDGTLVKWSATIRTFGRNRPFYSKATISEFLSGVYSPTKNGLARDVFFGPLGPQMERHELHYMCGDEPEECCLFEDYIIKAEVAIEELTATDEWVFAYECEETNKYSSQRMFVNAASPSDWPDNTGNNPEWITWADGIHMLKFQIAHNPADPDCPVPGADCFVECVKSLNPDAPIFTLQPGTIVTIPVKSGWEILWGVHFYEDPYTGKKSIAQIDHIISEKIAKEQGIEPVANIEIGYGKATDFYIRKNAVIEEDPHEMPMPKQGGSGLADLFAEKGILPNEWAGVCDEIVTSCSLPTRGQKWVGVDSLTATTTILIQIGDEEVETQLIGGGDYESGIPPIMVGFKEPLKAEVLEVRIPVAPYRLGLIIETDKNGVPTGRKLLPLEQVADGTSYITFVVEATFANEPVPDNVPVEIEVTGVVELASCVGESLGCIVSTSGIVRVKNINDPYINPDDPNNPGSVAKRSFAYFTINPLSRTVLGKGGVISVGEKSQQSLGSISIYIDYDKRGDLDVAPQESGL